MREERGLPRLSCNTWREAAPYLPGAPPAHRDRKEPGCNLCPDSAPLGASLERGQSRFCGDPFYLWLASLKEHRKAKACKFLVVVKITFPRNGQTTARDREGKCALSSILFPFLPLKNQTQKALFCVADGKAGRGNPASRWEREVGGAASFVRLPIDRL